MTIRQKPATNRITNAPVHRRPTAAAHNNSGSKTPTRAPAHATKIGCGLSDKIGPGKRRWMQDDPPHATPADNRTENMPRFMDGLHPEPRYKDGREDQDALMNSIHYDVRSTRRGCYSDPKSVSGERHRRYCFTVSSLSSQLSQNWRGLALFFGPMALPSCCSPTEKESINYQR